MSNIFLHTEVGQKLLRKKRDLTLERSGYSVFCTVEQPESAPLPGVRPQPLKCPGYLIAETDPV